VASVISGVSLDKFRAFREPTDIPLRKITLLYGQNSAGKSSIIKSLLMLQQTLVASGRRTSRTPRSLVFSGDSVDLGSFATTVSDHDTSRLMAVGLRFATPKGQSVSPDDRDESLVRWTVGEEAGRMTVTVETNGTPLRFHRWIRASRPYFFLDHSDVGAWLSVVQPTETLLNHDDPMVEDLRMELGYVPVFDGDIFPRRLIGLVLNGKTGDKPPTDSVEIISYDGVSEFDESTGIPRLGGLPEAWGSIARRMEGALWNKLRTLSYIGPLRREPHRFERHVPTEDLHVGSSGEEMLSHLYERPDVVTQVNNYLGMMELPYRIKVARLGSQETIGAVIYLALVNQATRLEVSPSDVGVGYSQVLPLITQAVLSRGSIVCIEQPELHLHPAMQARLGDLFIDQAIGGNDVQFIIETHSESLMLRFLRRVRDGQLRPDQIGVLYVDQSEKGTSIIHQLEIHESGEFVVPWPHGFFDERLEEVGF